MKPIKLYGIACAGRINGMGEPDPEGSYVEIVCTELDFPSDVLNPPQCLTFSISEGQAETLVAEIKGVLARTFATP